MSDIQGRVAFVTGGASGLGLSMARTFLQRGASVMLADRNAEGLERAVGGGGRRGGTKSLSGAGDHRRPS